MWQVIYFSQHAISYTRALTGERSMACESHLPIPHLAHDVGQLASFHCALNTMAIMMHLLEALL
jgi:hypothetical protein